MSALVTLPGNLAAFVGQVAAAGGGAGGGAGASGGSGGGLSWLTGPGGLSSGLDPTGAAVSALLKKALRSFGHALEQWIVDGTASLVEAVGHAVAATTTPSFGSAFMTEYDLLGRLGVELSALLLLFAVVQAVLRQDLGGLARAVVVRLPAAVLLGAGAATLVALALQATDEMAAALVGSPTAAVGRLIHHLASLLGGSGGTSPLDAGFAGVLVAVLAALVALVLWFELVVRSAAIVVATLFLPLALAGLVWQESTRWARRLAETLTALVLSKLVVVAVLALAAGSVSVAAGLSGLVEATALLALATLSPFSLLRLIPMVEAGAIGHLDGLGRRTAGAATGMAVRAGAVVRARVAERAAGSAEVPMAEGAPYDHPSVVAVLGGPLGGASVDEEEAP